MVNKVILVGNVGSDPEIRTFEDGSKVARFNLATTERFMNKNQERTDKTEWHRLVLWRGLAGVAEQYVRKGSQLYIEGRLRNTEWQDANGQKRYGVEIHVDSMNMLGRREASSQTGNSYGQPSAAGQNSGYQQQNNYNQDAGNQQQNNYSQNSQQSSPYKMNESQYDAPSTSGIDDDLPF